MTGCAAIDNATISSATNKELAKPTTSNGCEWVSFIGLSDYSLNALLSAQNNPEAPKEQKQAIRRDREKIAAHDEKWLVNCMSNRQDLS